MLKQLIEKNSCFILKFEDFEVVAKTDLRVKKTKLMIQQGFTKCINEKTFSKISIQDLTEAMMINKSTFYKYYEDKYDLREKMIAETIRNFSERLDVSFINPNQDLKSYEANLPKALLPIFHHREWLKVMWSPNIEVNVFEQMQNIVANKFIIGLYAENSEITAYDQLQANLFAASAMQVLLWWFEIKPTAPVTEIASIITKCLGTGTYYAFVQEK